MSDPRKALAELVEAHEAYRNPWGDVDCHCGQSWTSGAYPGYFEHVAELIVAQFLPIPHTEIRGYEYGAQYSDPGREPRTIPTTDRADALADAEHFRRVQGDKGMPVNAVAVSRPILPWTPIAEEPADA